MRHRYDFHLAKLMFLAKQLAYGGRPACDERLVRMPDGKLGVQGGDFNDETGEFYWCLPSPVEQLIRPLVDYKHQILIGKRGVNRDWMITNPSKRHRRRDYHIEHVVTKL
jgi:hypothetical protein